jgi:hypothetical protein
MARHDHERSRRRPGMTVGSRNRPLPIAALLKAPGPRPAAVSHALYQPAALRCAGYYRAPG